MRILSNVTHAKVSRVDLDGKNLGPEGAAVVAIMMVSWHATTITDLNLKWDIYICIYAFFFGCITICIKYL